ncbi:MAG: hypothetical protein PUE68_03215 [Kiritimatiellae bacterium]|nr:hypothetical protein [Kiritimatiellia bacterium]
MAAKSEDRHTGVRENLYFPYQEHQNMLEAMAIIHEPNKSNFIRSAVKSLAEYIKQNQKGETK